LSRVNYRLERLWLTPIIRNFIRFGLPIFLIIIICSTYFSKSDNLDILKVSWREFRENIKNRPEFLINLIKIDGVKHRVSNEIRTVMNLDLPISSYDLDLENIKNKVQLMSTVETANMFIADNIIHVEIRERKPSIIWQNNNNFEILDANGISISSVNSRDKHLNLPLIAGQGANKHVKQALFIYHYNLIFSDQLIGLVRVGNRRWNMDLINNRKVMLPSEGINKALKKMIELNSIHEFSFKNFNVLDLRNINRVIIRKNNEPTQMIEIKLDELGKGEI
jgi:cell division protein FtsQ